MQTLAKILTGTAVVGAMAVAVATPAFAQPYYRDYGRPGVGPREAVDQCVAAATRTANRYSGRARVTGINDVDRRSYGYKVEGRIAVVDHGWRGGDRYGWGDRDWGDRDWGRDTGRFECRVDYRGRVADVNFRGIRGL